MPLIQTNRISAAAVQHEQTPRKVQRITSALPDRMLTTSKHEHADPDSVVQSILGTTPVEVLSYSSDRLTGFFLPPTPEEIDAYSHDVLAAVRTQDLATLQNFYQDGRPLKCSNRFGESLLHLACRKGLLQAATFLIRNAQVPLQVCDDYGRSPLHDACWSHRPCFDLLDLILTECPDLLYIKDKRGFTPLKHVRRELWGQWNAYLRSKSAEFLRPKRRIQNDNHKTKSPAATA